LSFDDIETGRNSLSVLGGHRQLLSAIQRDLRFFTCPSQPGRSSLFTKKPYLAQKLPKTCGFSQFSYDSNQAIQSHAALLPILSICANCHE
jgi:hypothetical protein